MSFSLLLVLLAFLNAADASAQAHKPNIILILADDLSFRDLSAWGQQRFRTPNLDRLAAAGVRFTNAYAGAPECAPSRGTLLTGLHTGHAPIRANRSARGQDHLRDEDVTIAELLKRAGYAAGFSGKWGVGLPGTPGAPDRQGFDYSFGFLDQRRAHTYFPHFLYENGRKIPLTQNNGFDMQGLYAANVLDPVRANVNRYDPAGRLIATGPKNPSDVVYSEDLVEDRALRFIRGHADQPFFLEFATQLPHGPPIIDELGALNNRQDFPTVKQKEWAAMVLRLDRFAGQLVALLDKLGIQERTAIIFASDNGYSMCGYMGRGNANNDWPDDPFLRNKGPFRGGKFSPLEGGIRVPFFVHWPQRFQGGVSDVPVWLIDLMPTFAEWAGVKIDHSIDGDSLVPLLEGRPRQFPSDRALYWAKLDEQAVRMGPWKAYRKHPDAPLELYLIGEDPACERDLAALYPAVAGRIKQVMAAEHVDHPWYHNPGETAEMWDAKQLRARELGELQEDLAPNSSH